MNVIAGSGAPADPHDGAPADPGDGAPADRHDGAAANPNDRAPADPHDGAPADPGDGAPADRHDGAAANPNDRAPADPHDGAPADPGDGAPADRDDGAPANPGDGAAANPNDRAPADPHDGTQADPGDGAPADRDDGAPANPGDGAAANPNDRAPADPHDGAQADPGDGAPADLGAAMARLLLNAGAVAFSREHPFILAAGWASPVYVDCRLLIGEPAVRRDVTLLAAAKLRRSFGAALPFDAIAGAETAGIPWACWLADRLNLNLRYVRKRALGIGQNAQVEGGPVDGQRVLLVDDLTTDGGSKAAFTRGLRAAGAVVSDALSLFFHGTFPGAAERLAALNLNLHALATWRDVLAVGQAGTLSEEDHAELERFVADPVGWSAAHGGRTTPIVSSLQF